jgi:glycosyltransferase involved in cell wall biosynthesis
VSRPSISCIITAWNDELYVGEALESVLIQDYHPFEVIVVDDGSTDATSEIVRAFGDRVSYVHQANAGCSAARNTGIRESGGDLIAFLDADDIWLPGKLDRQASEFDLRPELHACFTFAVNFWIDELREEAERFRGHRIAKPLPAYGASTMMTRTSIYEDFGWFDPDQDFGQTVEWVLRVKSNGAIVDHIPDVLTRRRIHKSNRSRDQDGKARDDFLHMLKEHLDRQRST